MKVVDKISGTENSFIVERSTFFDKAGYQVNLPLCFEKDFFNKIIIKNIALNCVSKIDTCLIVIIGMSF